ncbi:helix-turn-helix domain-containing protein [Streptomyces sp. NPDC059122]|uniref:helix-turn-helix domain-containing protein n=1 Tax=Streptomyces sp. NPDC059122 TaxID=3346732 RepID=UPI0036A8FC5D
MTPATAPPSRRTCIQCNREFLQEPRRGRPSSTCPACKTTARSKKLSPPDLATPEAVLNEIAEDLNRSANDLLAAVQQRAPAPSLLDRITTLVRTVQDAEAAAVQLGRRQRNSWQELAAAMNLSPERLRKRWTTDTLDRRLNQRRNQPDHPLVPHHPRPRPDDTAETTAPDADGARTFTPAFQLASALSCLQRSTGATIKETAAESGVSASYLSRILNGARLPSWGVVAGICTACNGNLAELRDLWEAAQRPPAPDADARPPAPLQRGTARRHFGTAIRALHLVAGRPDVYALRDATGLTLSTLTLTFHGIHVPNWSTTSRLILVLHGRPADIRPLWQAAYQEDPPDDGPRLSAGSFG